jgi:YD repeat-containing protein
MYDMNGFMTHKTDRNGNVTMYTYNGLGQMLTAVNSTDGTSLTNVYARTGALLGQNNGTGWYEYSYNSLGLLTHETYADGMQIVHNYTSTGRLYAGNEVECPTLGLLRNPAFEYDDVGRLKDATEDNLKYVDYEYDLNGNRASLVNADGTSRYGTELSCDIIL